MLFRLQKMSTPNSNKIIQCKSRFGLGDALIDFIFFSKIAKYIEFNNIEIHYQCQEKHHSNLEWFNSSPNIKLLPYSDYGYDLWQGSYLHEHNVNQMLCNMFNDFLRHHKIPIFMDRFEYDDADLLIKHVESPASNVDILFINSAPKSGQFIHDKNELNQFIADLSKKYRVAVTERLDNMDGLVSLEKNTVREIAALAKTVKKVISVNTGPSLGLYNKDVLDNVEVVYILDTTPHYGFQHIRKFVKIFGVKQLQFLLE